jgi:superfamily II DNA or RNA helicase
MSEAPGISLEALFGKAPDSALRRFVGESTIEVLSTLNPEIVTRESLVRLAIGAMPAIQAIRDHHTRDQIIDMLPLVKATELGARLGLAVAAKELYAGLQDACAKRSSEEAILKFFGIVLPERAVDHPEASEKEIRPTYGLFAHQRIVAAKAVEALTSHPYATLVHMPTGSGKTRTAMHIVATILQTKPDRLIVWLAQTSELLEQAASEFEKAWSALGDAPANLFRFWGDHAPDIANARSGFLVAGFGKLYALYKRNPNLLLSLGDRASLTIVDEAHQAIAPTYRDLISSLFEKKPKNALLGLTATPGRTWNDRNADAELADFFHGKKVILEIEGYSNPVDFLIANGYLAKARFSTLNSEAGLSLSPSDVAALASDADVPESLLARLSEDHQRNIRIITKIEELCLKHNRVIVFAASVRHAHLIASILELRGTTSFVVTGTTDTTTRERVLVKFKGEDPNPVVIVNYGVLTTGFDAPKTSAALIARPTKSLVLYSQMVGRAIRGERAGGNREAEIVTVTDPNLPGFGDVAEAFTNWEDVWIPLPTTHTNA